MTKRFAGFMAILAFFVTCVSGLVADTTMLDVLLRALSAMAVFFLIGLLIGYVANRILLDSLFGEETAEAAEAVVDEVDAEQSGPESPPA